ncbi:hypothetical protein PENSUB_1809 [Penicillium subrubescens]|uniref:Uncharacterized protein n=1 Tax=Penicillium subrubescens TaxID=1316194 RepID=A0A1Q5UJ96_9EURO|nr:hypothetical protein PENSUB_1809 [Penicillium subrubescens]
MAPGSNTRGRLSPHQHELLLHESGNNTNGQNTVGIIVFDRESVQGQSIEKIFDKNELLERDFYGMVEKRGKAFRIRVVRHLVLLKSRQQNGSRQPPLVG